MSSSSNSDLATIVVGSSREPLSGSSSPVDTIPSLPSPTTSEEDGASSDSGPSGGPSTSPVADPPMDLRSDINIFHAYLQKRAAQGGSSSSGDVPAASRPSPTVAARVNRNRGGLLTLLLFIGPASYYRGGTPSLAKSVPGDPVDSQVAELVIGKPGQGVGHGTLDPGNPNNLKLLEPPINARARASDSDLATVVVGSSGEPSSGSSSPVDTIPSLPSPTTSEEDGASNDSGSSGGPSTSPVADPPNKLSRISSVVEASDLVSLRREFHTPPENGASCPWT
ncbi:mucin-1-like [Telopea speciosissima]|uniref:mucin-1-like n=1 Tax=Telopea speciosissima TaxID=54955 RepID=UPI001CC6E593|nr:mucin-1-like [Telopea speciosissima]